MDISKLFKVVRPDARGEISPGLHHFARERDGAICRFHLRVDSTGDGLLVANAAAMARLSSTGVVIAKALLEGEDLATITARVKKLFRGASAERVAADMAAVEEMIERMESPDDGYPILNLADPALGPKSLPLERPLMADVTLCSPFHTSRIMERLWTLGIPHVTFVVGSDCDRTNLIRAVERGSDLGLITGVRGRGTEMAAGNCINDMAAAGLDHLDVYCFSVDNKIHDALAGQGDGKMAVRALATAIKCEVCAVAQLALVRSTLDGIDRTLEVLAGHGIENASVFAVATAEGATAGLSSSAGDIPRENTAGQASSGTPFQQALKADELPPAAAIVEESAEQVGMRLMWQPTVRFDPAIPLGEQLCRGPRAGGDWSIRVEPDGTVFLPRGPAASPGNLLEDDWDLIADSEPYKKYRERLASDTRCDECPGLSICAADCPREPAGWG